MAKPWAGSMRFITMQSLSAELNPGAGEAVVRWHPLWMPPKTTTLCRSFAAAGKCQICGEQRMISVSWITWWRSHELLTMSTPHLCWPPAHTSTLLALLYSTTYWIGYERGAVTFEWTDGLSRGYENWLPANPSSYHSCAIITTGRRWQGEQCNRAHATVCKRGN